MATILAILPHLSNEVWINIGENLDTKSLFSLSRTDRLRYALFCNTVAQRGVDGFRNLECTCRRPERYDMTWKNAIRHLCGCKSESNPALWAIRHRNLEALQHLLNNGLDINHHWKVGYNLSKELHTIWFSSYNDGGSYHPWSLLTYAIFKKKPDMMRMLIDNGADVNKTYTPENQDPNDATILPLTYAFKNSWKEMADVPEKLEDRWDWWYNNYREKIETLDEQGSPLQFYGVRKPDFDVIRQLLLAGADCDSKEYWENCRLHPGHVEDWLDDYFVDDPAAIKDAALEFPVLNIAISDFEIICPIAARMQRYILICSFKLRKLLLQKETNLDSRNKAMCPPLHVLLSSRYAGDEIQVFCSAIRGLLTYSYVWSHLYTTLKAEIRLFRDLVEQGADPKIQNHCGKLSLDRAVDNEIAKLLIAYSELRPIYKDDPFFWHF